MQFNKSIEIDLEWYGEKYTRKCVVFKIEKIHSMRCGEGQFDFCDQLIISIKPWWNGDELTISNGGVGK